MVEGDQTIPILSSHWSAEPVEKEFPSLRTLPSGDSRLRLEYHSGSQVHLLDEKPLRIIRNKLRVAFVTYGRNGCIHPDRAEVPLARDPGLWGAVTITGEERLEGLRVQLVACYTPSTSRSVAGPLAPEESVLIPVFEKELSADANETLTLPFAFELPERAGLVELELRPKDGQGEVHIYPRDDTTAVVATPVVPAFPGAEGWGMYATGGRGGAVYTVTNLDDSGPGSLREALEAEGPRTVVFAVSGTIELESPLVVRNPHLTIAGQTAPGDGITLRNHPLLIRADHVVVRFIRVRPGDEAGEAMDAVEIREADHVILDHVTLSWGSDEIFNNWHGGQFHTFQ